MPILAALDPLATGFLLIVANALIALGPQVYQWPSGPVESPEQLAAETDAYLISLEGKGLYGVVLISHNGKAVLHKAYGYADRESGRRMTTETGHCIGSIVKPMTKAAIFKLESAGKLRLDDKLSRHFNDVPPDKADITLQNVLDHKAGFPDVFGEDYELVQRDWVVDQLFKAELMSKPGERRVYSNAGYSLLGAVIEKTSGVPNERYVYEQILKPAGVTRIGYKVPGWKNEDLAVGYQNGKRWGTPLDHPWMEDGPSWNLRANGGMLATAEELHRWFDAVLGGRALPPEATAKFRDSIIGKARSGRRVVAVAGGNGISNSLYINAVDSGFVFVMFTSVDEFAAEDVFPPIRERIENLLKPSTGD